MPCPCGDFCQHTTHDWYMLEVLPQMQEVAGSIAPLWRFFDAALLGQEKEEE